MTSTEQRTQINSTVDAKTEECYRSILKEAILPMFNAWFNSLDERGEIGKLPGKVIAEEYGCTENSGLALMFTAFAGAAMALTFDQLRDEAAGE